MATERPAGSYGPDLAVAEAPVETVPPPEAAPPTPPAPSASVPQGPPDWWFSGERREGTSVSVCAAGFGADLQGARDAAIDAARERLLLFVPARGDGAGPGRVERLSVMPLPSAHATAARYVGYAMISAEGN